jgi:bacterioferritin (cytochrome b1)
MSADILEARSVVSNILCFRLICTVTYKLHMFMTGDTATYKLYM